jgi:hypothetical protein
LRIFTRESNVLYSFICIYIYLFPFYFA